jgi:ATP-binding cassette subfamily B protein RaxB
MSGQLPLRFSSRPSLPVVLQTEAAECGLACLAMVAGYHGRQVDLNSLRRDHAASLRGVSLKSLISAANQLHFFCRPLRVNMDELGKLRTPAILHWDMGHFVVLERSSGRRIVVHDPALGRRTYTLREASMHVTGVALELSPTQGFERKTERARIHLTDLWAHAAGLKKALLQLLAVSLLLQIFALASPFYMQLVVDEGLSRHDQDLLAVLAVAFLLLVLISLGTKALRSYLVLLLGSQLSFQIATNLFHHLVRLPVSYFEKRHMGDVVSRFGSLEPIRALFTTGLITAVIDGVMAVATLVMIFVYSPLLSWVVLGAMGLYGAARATLYPPLRKLSEQEIVVRAREASSLMETVRAIQSIKVFSCEADREASWQNRYADRLNAGIRLGKLTITYEAISGLLFGLENVLVVYMGAQMVLAAEMSIGMLFAFMSYKGQFTGRISALVDHSIELRMLDLHLIRLADIALTPQESGLSGRGRIAKPMSGRLELVDLAFRYSTSDPMVFRNLNVVIESAQSIAITGPSGCGKTTLVKVMLGLLEPSRGEVRVDGRPLEKLGLSAYRGQTAAVMQDDQLLTGSIADNICFFDPVSDFEKVESCAKIAVVHDEIMAMPMQYNSLIGDLGLTLSAGQRQRVLLARALYREPRVLFLDEGTSHLDARLEARINAAIQELDVTRIMVTHRPELIRIADHELALRH